MVSSQLANLTIAAPFVGLTFQAASVEQGKEIDLVVKVAKAVDFPGEAEVTLIGLPNKVTTDVKKITKDTHRPRLPHQDRPGLAGRQPRRTCSARWSSPRTASRSSTTSAPASSADRRAAAPQAERRRAPRRPRPPPPPSPPRRGPGRSR